MMSHYRLERIKVGNREALVDVMIDGYLTPVEIGEIVTEAIKLEKAARTKMLRSHNILDLQLHFIPVEGD